MLLCGDLVLTKGIGKLQLLEKALEASGDDLDSALKSLNELCLESTGFKTENGQHTVSHPLKIQRIRPLIGPSSEYRMLDQKLYGKPKGGCIGRRRKHWQNPLLSMVVVQIS
ncbi:unnamed protein product [Urochloa humidicola]